MRKKRKKNLYFIIGKVLLGKFRNEMKFFHEIHVVVGHVRHGKCGRASWEFWKLEKNIRIQYESWCSYLFSALSEPFGNRFALPQPQNCLRASACANVCVCVCVCHVVVWGLLSPPRGLLALSLCLSRSLSRHALDSETRAAAAAAAAAQYQQQHQPQLTEIILVEFQNFYFNSVISKKYKHTHTQASRKCDFECFYPNI